MERVAGAAGSPLRDQSPPPLPARLAGKDDRGVVNASQSLRDERRIRGTNGSTPGPAGA